MSRRTRTELSRDAAVDRDEVDVAIDDADEAREEIRATIAALMPWGISILAHVALIVIAFFIVWQTIVQQPEPPTVPRLSMSPNVSSPISLPEDPTQDTSAGGAAFTIDVSVVDPTIEAVGFELPGLPTVGDTTGDLDSPFRGPGKDKIPGKIFTDEDDALGSAHEVVFLIDASGSMVDVLPFVIAELKEVVNAMGPVVVDGRVIEKKATVIFFSGEGVNEVPGGGGVKGLRTLTPKFKDDIRQWVALENFNYGTGGRGSLHVREAITRALNYRPDLLILLSDNLTGGGQGATQHELMQDALMKLIHQHNKANPPTRINTIQFLYEDPLVRAGLKGTLTRIADETGGVSRFIGQSDLNLR